MFLSGLIFGMLIGVLLIKLHRLLNEVDSEAKRMTEDAKATYQFWKERRKTQN